MSVAAEAAARPVLVAGAINTDLVARVDKAPDAGETVTGSSFAIFGGGKGANQAIAAARSGAPTAMLGALGDDDFGRQRRADLDAEGIDTESVARRERPRPASPSSSSKRRPARTASPTFRALPDTIAADQARAAVARVQTRGGADHPGTTAGALAALFEAGKRQGATVVLNATPEAIGARPFLMHIDVLIVNETEAEDLLGSRRLRRQRRRGRPRSVAARTKDRRRDARRRWGGRRPRRRDGDDSPRRASRSSTPPAPATPSAAPSPPSWPAALTRSPRRNRRRRRFAGHDHSRRLSRHPAPGCNPADDCPSVNSGQPWLSVNVGGQPQVCRHGAQSRVERPKAGASSQPHRSEQMNVDVPYASTE